MSRDVTDAVRMLAPEDDLSNMLELHFSCQRLPNLDTLSKSDPFVIVYLKDNKRYKTKT